MTGNREAEKAGYLNAIYNILHELETAKKEITVDAIDKEAGEG